MSKAFVYTELQINVPFDEVPWQDLNPVLKSQPGLVNKTWLVGVGTNTVGGLYEFDSIENAQKFVTGYFPTEPRNFGVAHTSRIFNGAVVEEASKDMNSVHFGGTLDQEPGAYVYTEVQLGLDFADVPWKEMNPVLKSQPGLLAKTWLSGVGAKTPGGFYAFDTIENAQKFAIDYFPTEAAELNAAFKTMVFDAAITKEASIDMNSPVYEAVKRSKAA